MNGPGQAPTKAAVLELRNEQVVVNEAYVFLDEKRLLLASELLRQLRLYQELGKELEDLEEWDKAFAAFEHGARARRSTIEYDEQGEIQTYAALDKLFTQSWMDSPGRGHDSDAPIFVVGLPRTGTTLTERIIASHSRVESADESFFLQIAVRSASGVQSREDVSTRMIRMAARENPAIIRRHYLSAIGYRLGGKPLFVEKYPLNFLYLGFIARAFPEARIVHLRRHPMDACFAMYKQSFFRFAYTLDDLAEYYIAYDRLSRHWREHLGDRIVEVEYESLVSDPDARVRELLAGLGLEFEQACVDFHLNSAPSATASAVQIREKAHTRSVARWKRFEKHLRPLCERLEQAGIRTG